MTTTADAKVVCRLEVVKIVTEPDIELCHLQKAFQQIQLCKEVTEVKWKILDFYSIKCLHEEEFVQFENISRRLLSELCKKCFNIKRLKSSQQQPIPIPMLGYFVPTNQLALLSKALQKIKLLITLHKGCLTSSSQIMKANLPEFSGWESRKCKRKEN
jgi:hypothetical protein